jgi:PEP-CTERM motif
MKHLVFLLVLSGAALVSNVRAAEITLASDPASGIIAGMPGQTVGWGFTITNTSSDFLIVSGTDFLPPSPLGSFEDYISQYQFVLVGPGMTPVSQTFDAGLQTGVGSFTISPTATNGDVISSVVTIYYDLYSVSPFDPNFDPDADAVSFGNTLAFNAEVDVVPEPATWFPVGAALAAGYFYWRRRRISKAA